MSRQLSEGSVGVFPLLNAQIIPYITKRPVGAVRL